jgi:WD40 repeat protein
MILRRHLHSVSCLCWIASRSDSESLWLASGSVGGEVKVWNLSTRRVCWELQLKNSKDVEYNIISIHVVHDYREEEGAFTLIVQCKEGKIFVYTVSSSVLMAKQQQLRFVGEGKQTSANTDDPLVAAAREPRLVLETNSVSFMQCALLNRRFYLARSEPQEDEGDSNSSLNWPASLLATSSMEGESVCVWDWEKSKVLCEIDVAKVCTETKSTSTASKMGMVMCCRLLERSGGALVLLCGMESGHVVAIGNAGVGDPETELFSVKMSEEPLLTLDALIEVRASAAWLVGCCAGAGSDLFHFKLNLDELASLKLSKVALPRPGIGRVCIRDDRKVLASGGWDSRVRVFGFKKLTPLAILKSHTATVNDVAYAPKGSLLATASKDGSIAVYDLYKKK